MKKINLKMVSVILILVLMTGNIVSAYSAETGKNTDVNNANTINSDFEAIAETKNTENGKSDASDEAEIITGTEWWAEGNEKTRDIPLTGDGTVNYSVRPVQNTENNLLSDAFVVEFYDENKQYFTTTSFGDAWYAGLPETTESTFTKMPSIEKSIIQNLLSEISVEISRSGSVFTITYTNLYSGEVYEMTADAKEMAETVYIHVFAQFGTFEVTEGCANSTYNYEAVTEYLNKYYIEKYPQIGLEVIPCQPSVEETYQQVLQDIMSERGEKLDAEDIYSYIEKNICEKYEAADHISGETSYTDPDFLCQLLRRAGIPAVISGGYMTNNTAEWVLAYDNEQWILLDPYRNRMLNNKEEICRWYFTANIEGHDISNLELPDISAEGKYIDIDTNEPMEMGKAGYVEYDNKICYMQSNGQILRKTIRQIDEKLCYFDHNGYAVDITDLKDKCTLKGKLFGDLCIAAGTTFKISSIMTDNDKEYTWKSSDEDIIRTNGDGSFTVAEDVVYKPNHYFQGNVVLQCEEDADMSIGIYAVQAEIVEEKMFLTVGMTSTLNAVKAADSAECKYIWKSSDSSIAEVDGEGKVTAKKRGAVEIAIKAIQEDGTETTVDSCKVVAAPKDNVISGTGWWQEGNERTKDTALTGDGTVNYIVMGSGVSDYYAFMVEFYDENNQYFTTTSSGDAWYNGLPETTSSTFTKSDLYDWPLMWNGGEEILVKISRNGSIFTVTYTNLNTGLAHEMTANTKEMADTVYTHVSAQAGRIYVAESLGFTIDEQLNLTVGSTSTINAVVDPELESNYGNYNWISSDYSIAYVDGDGNVTANKAGVAEVTPVLYRTGVSMAKCTVVVTSDDTKVKQEKSGEDIYIIYDKDTIPDDVNLEVEKIEENHNDYESIKPEENVEFVAYDINLRDNKNNKVQPKGSVKVRIPCPRDYIGKNCKVYYVSPQGKYVEMKSEYSGGFIVFETTHFSTYMLTADKLAAGETEEQVKYGDVNGDGDIDTKDAVLIKKHLAGYTGLAMDLNACDVNGDGDITSADAVLLLKYLAGYNVALGR